LTATAHDVDHCVGEHHVKGRGHDAEDSIGKHHAHVMKGATETTTQNTERQANQRETGMLRSNCPRQLKRAGQVAERLNLIQ
jgi:hypothetical protein